MIKFKDVVLVSILALLGAFSFGLLTGYHCGAANNRKPTILVVPMKEEVEKETPFFAPHREVEAAHGSSSDYDKGV